MFSKRPSTRAAQFAHRCSGAALVSLVAWSATACQTNQAASEKGREATAAASAPATAAGRKAFGAELEGKAQRVTLAELVEHPKKFAGRTVAVEGHVRRACSKKGCWMEISADKSAEAAGCRVTFKDYGFFVPTDSAGSNVRAEGVVEIQEIKKSHVEHLEQEGATFASKNDDGTATEVQLVATGVELWRG